MVLFSNWKAGESTFQKETCDARPAPCPYRGLGASDSRVLVVLAVVQLLVPVVPVERWWCVCVFSVYLSTRSLKGYDSSGVFYRSFP